MAIIVSLVTVTPSFLAMHTTMHSDMAHAIEDGNSALVKKIIRVKSQVNAKDKDGNTPLHLVAKREGHPFNDYKPEVYLKIVRLLLRKGAHLNEKNNKGETPLYFALYEGSLKTAELIILAGAEINERMPHYTPLFCAVALGRLNIVKLLIQKGAKTTEEKYLELGNMASPVFGEIIKLLKKLYKEEGELEAIEDRIKGRSKNNNRSIKDDIANITFNKRTLHSSVLIAYAYHQDDLRDKQGKNIKEAIGEHLPVAAVPFIFSSEPKLEFIRALLLQARKENNKLFARNLLATQRVVTLLNQATESPLPREIVGKIISFTDGRFVFEKGESNSNKKCLVG